jgi:site-specific DNA recombinase
MRVAAYVRVSTPGQVKLQTIDQQLETIHRYVQDKGWELPDENVFRDDGFSGASLDRPALDLLRDKARIRELDVVVLLSPDRLARNYVHQMVLIVELEKCGCRVEFVERPMSSEPNDQLLLQIRGAVAEYERTLVKERMRRGKLAKLKAGLLLPWTRCPYGYRTDPDKPRDPDGVRLDEEKAAVVAEIFAMYLEEGETLCGVANKLRDRGVRSPRGGRSGQSPPCEGSSPTLYTRAKSTPGERPPVRHGYDARPRAPSAVPKARRCRWPRRSGSR